MTVPDLQTLAQVFTGRLLNTAAEGVVLAGLVWVLLRLIGRRNSGTRFAIWFSALLQLSRFHFLPGQASSPHLPARFLPRTCTEKSSFQVPGPFICLPPGPSVPVCCFSGCASDSGRCIKSAGIVLKRTSLVSIPPLLRPFETSGPVAE
jgi:hypothetical protein